MKVRERKRDEWGQEKNKIDDKQHAFFKFVQLWSRWSRLTLDWTSSHLTVLLHSKTDQPTKLEAKNLKSCKI